MQRSEITSSLSRSGLYVFIGKLIKFVLQYFTQILLINFLCPDDFGLMRYVTILLGIVNMIVEFGLGTAIIQKQNITSEQIGSSFIVSLIWGGLLFLLFFLTAPIAASFFNDQRLVLLLRVAAIVIPFGALNSIPKALLQKKMLFGKLAFTESTAAVISSVVMVIMALRGYGTWSLVAGSVLLEVISMPLIFSIVWIPVFDMSRFKLSKDMLSFGIGIVFQRIIDYLAYGTSFFVMGKFFSATALGIYSISHDLAVLPQRIISAVLGTVVISTFSRIQHDTETTKREFDKLLRFSTIIGMPALVLMSFLSTELISVICFIRKNDTWLPAADTLRWLSIVGVVYIVSIFPSPIWLSKGKVKEAGYWAVTMLVTHIAAVFTGMQWGSKGIVIAMCIRGVSVMPLFIYLNYRLTGIPVSTYLKGLLPSGVCSIFMAVPVFLISAIVPGSSLARHFTVLSISAISGTAVYLLILKVFFKDSLQIVVSFTRFSRKAGSTLVLETGNGEGTC